jgi:hypothetical protein
MRWFPFLLVVLSGVSPIEQMADTLEGELIIRSSWSVLLVVSLYFCINVKRLALILCCEFLSITYNLAIALGYFFTDKDLTALYEPLMLFLFGIEIIAVLPGRTRRDSRYNGNSGRSVRKRAYGHHNLATSNQVQVATCKI